MNIHEPSKGRNRALYQHAIDAATAEAARFTEFNPTRVLSARITWRSTKSGYMVRIGYYDTFTGGFCPVATTFSKW